MGEEALQRFGDTEALVLVQHECGNAFLLGQRQREHVVALQCPRMTGIGQTHASAGRDARYVARQRTGGTRRRNLLGIIPDDGLHLGKETGQAFLIAGQQRKSEEVGQWHHGVSGELVIPRHQRHDSIMPGGRLRDGVVVRDTK